MTTVPPSAESRVFELYDRFPRRAPFSRVNEAGAVRFGTLGFPQKKHEAFTFVNLREFLSQEFEFVDGPEKPLAKEDVKRFVYAGCEKSLVVMADGRFSTSLSDLSAHGGSLEAAELDGSAVRLSEIQTEGDAFAALNALFLTGGVKIAAREGYRSDVPLQILNLSTGRIPSGGGVPAHSPRVEVVMSPGSKARMVLKSAGLAPRHLVNGVISADLGEGAELDLTMIQADPPDSYHFFKTLTRQEKDSKLNIVCATNGGKLVRRNFECRLKGEGATLSLLGLAILGGSEQSHNYVRVFHEAPSCSSFEHYKNILSGKAVSSVDTTVTVRPGAQLALSRQLINNLMFSPTARADSKPRLMIRADDVRCNHGATVGRIDKDQVFYLMSRGLSEGAAKSLIVTGFAKAILDAIPAGPAADDASALLLGKMGEGFVG